MLELTTSTSLAVQGKTPLTGITIRNFSAKAIKHRRHRLPSRLPSNLAMHYFGSASAHVRTAPEKNLVRVLRRRNQKRHPLTRNQLSSDISTIATDDDNDARQALLQPRQQRALCRQKLTRTERQRLHRAGRSLGVRSLATIARPGRARDRPGAPFAARSAPVRLMPPLTQK